MECLIEETKEFMEDLHHTEILFKFLEDGGADLWNRSFFSFSENKSFDEGSSLEEDDLTDFTPLPRSQEHIEVYSHVFEELVNLCLQIELFDNIAVVFFIVDKKIVITKSKTSHILEKHRETIQDILKSIINNTKKQRKKLKQKTTENDYMSVSLCTDPIGIIVETFQTNSKIMSVLRSGFSIMNAISDEVYRDELRKKAIEEKNGN